ncbi:MAG: ribbon-helix-helix protein, CopG family [Microthrixaceae bacterium]|nr:ribbon-helix-helix protein, CopG family [Microthrixaceae bacterium]
MTTPVTLRVPDELLTQLDALVPEVHPSRSEGLRRALELYLYRVACERDAERYAGQPLSEAEIAVGDDVRDWEATPSW